MREIGKGFFIFIWNLRGSDRLEGSGVSGGIILEEIFEK
jgi:hypothetical protein